MKIFNKIKKENGCRDIYICGIKFFSYHKALSKQNSFSICADLNTNKLVIPQNAKGKIKIFGKNNTVIVEDGENISLNLIIYGNGNQVFIKSTRLISLIAEIGTHDCKTNDAIIEIGENTLINGLYMRLLENNSNIKIGKNCLFSDKIEFWCSDTHCIFDENKKLLNYGRKITIGDNVWIGMGAKILKNSNIPSGCIVGMDSVVAKAFSEEKCILAGNPARIVKSNILWSQDRPNEYIGAK